MSGRHVFTRGEEPTLERLLAATQPDGECLVWARAIDRYGYGRVQAGSKCWGAHRLSYTLANGPIPDGMTVDHLCFRTACVNPLHLRLLTQLENARNQRSALATECQRGHAFTPENVYWRTDRAGRESRTCRTCLNEGSAARRTANRRAGRAGAEQVIA